MLTPYKRHNKPLEGSYMEGLENKLAGPFGKDAPVKLPENGKKGLVQFMPWLALVFGIIQLLVAWGLWHWAHVVNYYADVANALCSTYATACNVSTSRLTVTVWLALIVLVLDAILLLAAFPGLRDRKKGGWNLLLYSVLLNFVYGIVSLFTSYSSKIGSFIGSLIGLVIGLWLLFQVRDYYTGKKSVASNAAPKDDTPKV